MLRHLVGDRIRAIVGGDRAGAQAYRYPAGDPGLFGPASMAWVVHADFTAMMVGGVSALLLQCLHPLALAGVWDHSRFREDMRGRLARTAGFIAATTYGAEAVAHAALARVRSIHAQVSGQHPDGRPYRADDPHLLYWVHLAECSSFLAAYQALVTPALTDAQADRYWQEMALIPQALGCRADDLPTRRFATSVAEADTHLAHYRPELCFDVRTADVVQRLRALPAPAGTAGLRDLVIEAGFLVVPEWGRRLLQLPTASRARRTAILHAARLTAPPVRWALGGGIAAHARLRCPLPP